MFIIINENNLILSKGGEWVRLTDWKQIKVFEHWSMVERVRLGMEGDGVSGKLETKSLHEILDNICGHLSPIIQDLNDLMSTKPISSIAVVGGKIEMKNLIAKQQSELNALKKQMGKLKKKIKDYETD